MPAHDARPLSSRKWKELQLAEAPTDRSEDDVAYSRVADVGTGFPTYGESSCQSRQKNFSTGIDGPGMGTLPISLTVSVSKLK